MSTVTVTPNNAHREGARARLEAERRAQAEQIAHRALDSAAYVPGDRLSFQRALEVATKAALAAMVPPR